MPLPAFRRNDAGSILCSTSDCDHVATWQTAVDCTDCSDVAAEAEQTVSDLGAELEEHLANAQQAAQALAEILLNAGDERRPLGRAETRQVVEAQSVVDEARRAAAQAGVGQRQAQHSLVMHSAPHTHPLFGCDDHPQEA